MFMRLNPRINRCQNTLPSFTSKDGRAPTVAVAKLSVLSSHSEAPPHCLMLRNNYFNWAIVFSLRNCFVFPSNEWEQGQGSKYQKTINFFFVLQLIVEYMT